MITGTAPPARRRVNGSSGHRRREAGIASTLPRPRSSGGPQWTETEKLVTSNGKPPVRISSPACTAYKYQDFWT